MVTPYTTPSVPSAPRTTPLTANHMRALRPPIHNPYDKFTQPDFDAWIGDITSALRKALGHESDPQGGGQAQSDATRTPEESEEEDEDVEDSFAEVKTRRAKGKARDPREGPGLGGRLQPIEIQSESESDGGVGGDSADGDEGYEWREDSEQDYAPAEFDVSDDGSDVVEIPNGRDSRGTSPGDVVELFSDEEEDELHGLSGERADNVDDAEGTFAEEFDGELDQEENDVPSPDANEKYRLGMAKFGLPEPQVQQETPTQGSAAELTTIDAEVDDFPPPHETTPSQPLELPDPWEGPQTYAEDFYSGGDLREHDLHSPSPSHLTPVRDDIGIGFMLTPGILTPRDDERTEGEEGDVLPNSSPLASSPMDGVFKNINGREHIPDDWYGDLDFEGDKSGGREGGDDTVADIVSTTEVNGHMDWNWPPAFSVGKVASGPGHLATSPVRVQHIESEPPKAVEDEEGDVHGAVPLGTSDLDIYEHEGLYEGLEDVADVGKAESAQVQTPVDIQSREDSTMQFESITAAETLTHLDTQPASLPAGEQPGFADLVSSGLEPPADFGVLPTASLDSMPLVGEEEMPQLLTSLVGGENEQPSNISDVESQEIVRNITDEVAGMFEEMARQVAEETMGYTVIEVETEDEAGLINEFEEDVVSVSILDEQHGESIAYTVEEPVTDGRRTEEPDVRAPTREPSVVHTSDTQPDSHVPVPDTLPADALPMNEAEDHTSSVSYALTGEDFTFKVEAPLTQRDPSEELHREPETHPIIVDHTGQLSSGATAPLPSSNGSDAPVDAVDVSVGDKDEGPPVNSAGLVHTPQNDGPHDQPVSHSQVQTDIPMPISADPTVPDRITMATSPHGISSQPETPATIVEELTPASVPVPAPSPKALQPQQSLSTSGLFTPVNGTESGPGTPNVENDINQDDIAQISEEVPSNHQQMDIRDKSPIFDIRPEGTEILTNSEPSAPDVAFHSTPSTPKLAELPELPATSHQAMDSTEPDAHHLPHMSMYLTIPQSLEPTDPILYADPYPYSLSTPGSELHDSMRQVVLGDDLDMMSEEGEEQSSSSSSTASKGDKDIDPNNEVHSETEGLELLYPSDPELKPDTPVVGQVIEESLDQVDESMSGPEGAVDEMELSSIPLREPHSDPKPQLDKGHTIADEGPFTLMGNDSDVAPRAVEADTDASPLDSSQDEDGSPLERPYVNKPHETGDVVDNCTSVTGPETEPSVRPTTRETPPQQTNGQDEPEEDGNISPVARQTWFLLPAKRKRQPPLPANRKRNPPLPIPALLTRSKSAASPSTKQKGEEEEKDKDEKEHEGHFLDNASAENSSTSSGASSALRMLRTASDSTSRASPAPLFHTHGAAVSSNQPKHSPPLPHVVRHEHRPQKITVRAKDTPKEPGPSQSPQPHPISSPLVTRSRCRFHKISLAENGQRFYFVVPGCSLADGELMENLGIEDHGDATIEDSKQMVDQYPNFSSDLLGNLRQLVGLDLMREQEVFYLPQRYIVQPPSGRRLPQGSTNNMNADSSRPSTLSPVSSISRAPSSAAAGSTSTGSPIRKGFSDSDSLSALSCSESELSDGESGTPHSKRRKQALPVNVSGDLQTREMGPARPAAELRMNLRNDRRLTKRLMDAAAYQPPPEDGVEPGIVGNSRKSRANQGMKRARTSDAAGGSEGMEVRKEKKRKIRATHSIGAKHD